MKALQFLAEPKSGTSLFPITTAWTDNEPTTRTIAVNGNTTCSWCAFDAD